LPLQQVIEGKIKGRIEVKGKRGRRCRKLLDDLNPLPSLMLQSARDLNVLCRPKRSKALLLSYTFKYPLKKTQSFCPCRRVLNRRGTGLRKGEATLI
jgi:hypothetical protein